MLDLLALIGGIALLIAGGESLIRGSAALARQLGVPPLVIGLTVVAFGTSAPELAVNVTAALRGDGTVAFGNLVGSNLANVCLILAGSALFRPLAVEGAVITRELPMMLLGTTAAVVMGFDMLRGDVDSVYDRSDGVVLLLVFGVFLYYTAAGTLRRWREDPFLRQAGEQVPGERLRSSAISSGLAVVGLIGLGLGGQLTVLGAVGIAEAVGVPKGVISLSIVAIGTSLPELSASLLAARRGETDLAVGNVVGSNIFNLLFVLATTATLAPVPVPAEGGHADLLIMFAASAALLVACTWRRRLGRLEALLFLGAYVVYLTQRTVASG